MRREKDPSPRSTSDFRVPGGGSGDHRCRDRKPKGSGVEERRGCEVGSDAVQGIPVTSWDYVENVLSVRPVGVGGGSREERQEGPTHGTSEVSSRFHRFRPSEWIDEFDSLRPLKNLTPRGARSPFRSDRRVRSPLLWS